MSASSMKNEVRDQYVDQLRSLVATIDKLTEHVEEQNLLDGDDDGELGALLFDLRSGATAASNLAHTLSLTPAPYVFAGRIYTFLKGWVSESFAGKDLRNKGPFLTPGHVMGSVLHILEDDYAHLNDEQRDKIEDMTARILAAGDGINVSDVSDVRAMMRRENWSINDMLDACQVDDLSERLDFDPDTGKDWE